jgi:hypothetical protein
VEIEMKIHNADKKSVVVRSRSARLKLDISSGNLSGAVLHTAYGSISMRDERALRELLDVLSVGIEKLNGINSAEAVRA